MTGLEPAASCVTGRRSNQAELHPQNLWFKNGVSIFCSVTTIKQLNYTMVIIIFPIMDLLVQSYLYVLLTIAYCFLCFDFFFNKIIISLRKKPTNVANLKGLVGKFSIILHHKPNNFEKL